MIYVNGVSEQVGVVSDLCVDEGDVVERGQIVCQVESMKVMFPVYAPEPGKVHFVRDLGELVSQGETVFTVEVDDGSSS